MSLSDCTGLWIGAIELNEDFTARQEELPVGETCELIAISMESVLNVGQPYDHDFLEWGFNERPKTGILYWFYNVLWIERYKGIAYRKALGRVAKEKWEQLDLEEIDVTLG